MTDDDKFMKQIARLKDDQPSDDLYQRIMTVAPNMSQVSATVAAPQTWLQRFFGEWQYGLRVKFASLAVLGLMGFCVGHLNGPPAHQDSFFSAIITGDIGWED